MFGFYNRFIHNNLSEPFVSRKFARSWYEDKKMPRDLKQLPASVFEFDSKVRATMLGYPGGHTMYRQNSRLVACYPLN